MNPYAAPIDDSAFVPVQPIEGYDPMRGVVKTLTVALWVSLAMSLVGIVADGVELYLLQSWDAVDPTLADVNNTCQMAVGIVQLVVSIATVIVFARFLHRANKNARALGAVGMRFTPRGMIGWFFMPFANLYKPYQAVRETWQASDPEAGDAWMGAAVPWFLPLWWALWIASGVLNQIAFRLSWGAETIDAHVSADWASIVARSCDVPLTVVALLLVVRLHALQERKRATKTSAARP